MNLKSCPFYDNCRILMQHELEEIESMKKGVRDDEFDKLAKEVAGQPVLPDYEEEETEVETEPEEVPQEDEDNSRWSYYIIREVERECSSKNEVKKYLQETGIQNLKVIRGRQLATAERVKRIVSVF